MQFQQFEAFEWKFVVSKSPTYSGNTNDYPENFVKKHSINSARLAVKLVNKLSRGLATSKLPAFLKIEFNNLSQVKVKFT